MKKSFLLPMLLLILPLFVACLQYPEKFPNPDSIVDVHQDVVEDSLEDTGDIRDVSDDVGTDAGDAGSDADVADTGDVAEVDVVEPCVEGDGCDDDNPCTVDDECNATGECVGTLVAECDDGIECTVDSCSSSTACDHIVVDGFCLVGGVCYATDEMDVELFGQCKKCMPDVASDDMSPDDLLACDDASACTEDDQCDDGECKGTVVICDDENQCTDDSCDAVLGCQTSNNTNQCAVARCDGLMYYAAAVCSGGICPSVTPENCDDGNSCTTDTCKPTGCSHTIREGQVCAPARCEMGTYFAPSACVGNFCPPQDSEFCDDGDICTEDYCSTDAGCLTRADNTKVCREASCDGLTFSPEVKCNNKVCPPAVPRSCDDSNICTSDSCQLTGCVNAANTEPCTDSNPCTLNDTCQNKICKSGPIRNCDDGLYCTLDQCNVVNGECVHDYSGYCLIDGVCWMDSEVNPDNDCQQCQAYIVAEQWSSAFTGQSCDDYEWGDATCQAGQCEYECDLNRGDCDNDIETGCETDLLSDPDYCGDCETDCGTLVCSLGSCAESCDPSLDLCGGRCIDTDISVEHCGDCDQPCQRDNAETACVGGVCNLVRCDTGYFDVDLNPANGCECQSSGIELCDGQDNDCNGTTDDVAPEMLGFDPLNCGQCGRVCNGGDKTVYGFCSASNCYEAPCASNNWDIDKKPENLCEYFCVYSSEEVCGNAVDEDCDGSTENGC